MAWPIEIDRIDGLPFLKTVDFSMAMLNDQMVFQKQQHRGILKYVVLPPTKPCFDLRMNAEDSTHQKTIETP